MYYSQLSDFEINNLVALAIGSKVTDSYRVGDERETIYYSLGEDEFCVKRGYGSFVSQFDPCNNPADAWPIIDENNITIISDNPSRRYAVNNVAAFFNGTSGLHKWADENGFRAAMIVFLMMQDANHA